MVITTIITDMAIMDLIIIITTIMIIPVMVIREIIIMDIVIATFAGNIGNLQVKAMALEVDLKSKYAKPQ